MTELKMIYLFVEIAKNHIPDIDDTDLEYDLRQISIDENGPICSDGQLLDIFKTATRNTLDDGLLYRTIERICMDYSERILNTK